MIGWGNKLVTIFAEDTPWRLDKNRMLSMGPNALFLLLFSLKTGQIIVHLFTLYREPASIQQMLYPAPIAIGGKKCAKPSLHRDTFSAKVPGFESASGATNVYYHNHRAVSVNELTICTIDSSLTTSD